MIQAQANGRSSVHPAIRGDGEPVLTGFRTTNVVAVVNYGHVKQQFSKEQAGDVSYVGGAAPEEPRW